jgi:hypothetical protein
MHLRVYTYNQRYDMKLKSQEGNSYHYPGVPMAQFAQILIYACTLQNILDFECTPVTTDDKND